MRTFFFIVFLSLAFAFDRIAQDNCPLPRVKVINLIKLEQTSLTERLHNTLSASLSSYIINKNNSGLIAKFQ